MRHRLRGRRSPCCAMQRSKFCSCVSPILCVKLSTVVSSHMLQRVVNRYHNRACATLIYLHDAVDLSGALPHTRRPFPTHRRPFPTPNRVGGKTFSELVPVRWPSLIVSDWDSCAHIGNYIWAHMGRSAPNPSVGFGPGTTQGLTNSQSPDNIGEWLGGSGNRGGRRGRTTRRDVWRSRDRGNPLADLPAHP